MYVYVPTRGVLVLEKGDGVSAVVCHCVCLFARQRVLFCVDTQDVKTGAETGTGRYKCRGMPYSRPLSRLILEWMVLVRNGA